MALPIGDSWTRIITWLQANAPADAIEEFARETPDTMASLAAQMGIVFPDELTQFYQQLGGSASGSVLPSPDDHDPMAFSPLALEEMLAAWTGQKELVAIGQFDDCIPRSAAEIRNVWWDPGWIPFASNGGGDYLCVDTAPTAAGIVGQVMSHSHESGEHKLLSRSLADYLQDLALKVEQGHFVYDAKYGMCRPIPTENTGLSSDTVFTGMTDWHYANALSAGEEAFKNKDYALCVAHLERFANRLDKLAASRLAFARKKVAQSR